MDANGDELEDALVQLFVYNHTSEASNTLPPIQLLVLNSKEQEPRVIHLNILFRNSEILKKIESAEPHSNGLVVDNVKDSILYGHVIFADGPTWKSRYKLSFKVVETALVSTATLAAKKNPEYEQFTQIIAK